MGTKIKLCGLCRPEDIRWAGEAKPDFAGFILTPGFRRSITKIQASRFRERLNPEIPAVGVFVNASREEMVSFLKEDIIQMVQLHGDESEEDVRYLKEASGKPVIKAVKVHSRQDADAWLNSRADYLVFDGGAGAGRTFDWKLLEHVKRDYFLAGGLNAGNLAEALERLHPWAVDLSSGVETEGFKDKMKMKEAVRLVRRL